jgi:hypothetical protein
MASVPHVQFNWGVGQVGVKDFGKLINRDDLFFTEK